MARRLAALTNFTSDVERERKYQDKWCNALCCCSRWLLISLVAVCIFVSTGFLFIMWLQTTFLRGIFENVFGSEEVVVVNRGRVGDDDPVTTLVATVKSCCPQPRQSMRPLSAVGTLDM